MNDKAREVMTSIEKTQHLVQKFIISPALYTTIVIVQFVARMYKASMLKKTDWKDFDKFSKMCDYKFEVADIPVSKDGKEMAKADIKEQLDSMGVHYCMLENDFEENHIKIYYAQKDKQRFDNFLSGYIKEHLVSGEMPKEELKRMVHDKVSIISVPDALEDKLQAAMLQVDVSYAKIEDLNLADGKKQMYVPNHQLQTVSQLYQEIRNGLLAQGIEDPGAMQTMTQEELNATAICQNEPDFVARCDKKHQDVSTSFINDKSKSWDDIVNRYEPLGQKESVAFMQNENFVEISIDENTLVNNSGAQAFTNTEATKAYFCCKVPGTPYKDAKFLMIPKDQVFKDTFGAKTRYVAFLEKGNRNVLLDVNGKPDLHNEMCMTERLKDIFDPQESFHHIPSPTPNLSMRM